MSPCGELSLDLEYQCRLLYRKKYSDEKIVKLMQQHTISKRKAAAILQEIKNTENIKDRFVKKISNYTKSDSSADVSGLGCRGEGDFYIHHKLAEIIGKTGAVVDSMDQDDAGVTQVDDKFIVIAVDGMHSRLSHFPFLAGFHVTRAAIRDVMIMGGKPVALLSDIHLGNDGDVGKIFDYTAGISTVSELTEIPLISGSTLRIGGDLVLGDRLTGCVGAVGQSTYLTPRRKASPGDLILMSEGSGGGTIATTALYNGYHKVVKETLNLDFFRAANTILHSKLMKNIHAMTDVTNGGIRGDAFELANTANVRVVLDEKRLRGLVNPIVLQMLDDLKINYMGVSIDSLLLTSPEKHVDDLLNYMKKNKIKLDIIGRVEKGKSVYLEHKNKSSKIVKEKLSPKFREEPYTPIKKIVDRPPSDFERMKKKLGKSALDAKSKKEYVKDWILEH
jgi:hydrogenase expression/formation protein